MSDIFQSSSQCVLCTAEDFESFLRFSQFSIPYSLEKHIVKNVMLFLIMKVTDLTIIPLEDCLKIKVTS